MIQALGNWMKDYLSQVVSTRNAKAKELQEAILAREVIRKKNKDAGEDISDEDQRKQETAEEQVTILEEIVARLNYTEAFMKYSIDDMIKQSKSLIGKIDVLKKKLEAGDTTLPQESFMDYFVSPLH
jgi:hypothetical protein